MLSELFVDYFRFALIHAESLIVSGLICKRLATRQDLFPQKRVFSRVIGFKGTGIGLVASSPAAARTSCADSPIAPVPVVVESGFGVGFGAAKWRLDPANAAMR